jgi:C4-dicarboxylate-specific signal transduction histidine kinase
MVAFLVDAMVTVWRRGDQHQRRAAMLVAGSFALALLVAGVTTAAIGLGWLRLPMALNPMFLPALLAMSYQLGSEVVRAGILSERMSRKEAEITHLARVATIGELTGSLAHELTQPLTAIMSNAQAALGLVASGQHGSADMRECLIAILEGDKRAIEVIRRLRRMLKKQEIELQALDLNELVQDALELARSDLTSRGVRIGVELATRLPAVRGDRVQLQQVLLNLLLNACDAMQGMADEPQLNVCTRAGTAGNVELAVGDNGPGIAPDQLDRIFEPFVSTRRDGLGLGLTVARTIVSGHHGAIHAHNQSAGGACLVVTLPCEQSMNK